jgi:hypothetical protein
MVVVRVEASGADTGAGETMKLISAVLGCLVALVLASPAGAAPPLEHERYLDEGVDTFTDTECGAPITIEHSFSFSGLFVLKAGRRGDPTPYYMDNYEGRETFTNVANGVTATATHNAVFKDLKVEHLFDTTYRFTAIEAGRPIVVFGPDGERLIFDRGRIRFTFYVDTLGDTDLSNDVFLGADPDEVAGPHPIFLEEADFCDLLDLLR